MFKKQLIHSVAAAAILGVPASVSLPTAGWAQISEILVTTRKREENLQDVPISVEAFDSQSIEKFGIGNAQDLAKFSAGIQFDEGFGGQDTRIVIRGMSPTRGRPNAAFLVDGIDFTGEAVSTAGGAFLVNQRLVDVERIEVVKGPQSALYGRSAFAGAVQYITKNPNMDEFEAEAGFDFATDDQYNLNGAVSGPIAEGLGLRVNAIWSDEGGFHDNAVTGNEVGGSEGWGLAATTLWEATDSISFKLRAAYSEDEYEVRPQARVDSNFLQPLPPEILRSSGILGAFGIESFYPGCAGLPYAGGPPALGDLDGRIGSCFANPKLLVVGTMPDGDDLELELSPDPRTGDDYKGSEVDNLNVTLVSTWDLDSGTLTSYTGYANVESQQNFDSDWDYLAAGSYTSFDGLFSFTLPDCGMADCSPTAQEIDFANETKLFSQELRYQTDLDGPWNFTIGGLYWKEDVEQIENSATITTAVFRGFTDLSTRPVASLNLPLVDTANRVGKRDTEHWSLYGMAEWDINEQFNVTFEARYVHEEIDVQGAVCDNDLTLAYTTALGDAKTCSDFTTPSSPLLLSTGDWVQARTSGDVVKNSENFIAPKITLNWTPNDDALVYFSIADGVKPGGISTITAGAFFDSESNVYKAEKLRAYELGAKTTWLDNTLQLNSSVFFQDYSDKQVGVTQFDETAMSDVGRIANAGEAEIWGIDIEALWAPTENLTLSAAYTWLDAEYTKFEERTTSTTNIARNIYAGNGGCQPGSIEDSTPDGDSPDASCIISYTGNKIEDVPEHAFVGNIEYRAPLGNADVDWFVGGTSIYTSERFMDEHNVKLLDDYWTADLRAGLSAEQWDLTLYVTNVFDDDTVKSGVDVGSQVTTTENGYFPPGPTDGVMVSLPDPRVWGLRGKFRF